MIKEMKKFYTKEYKNENEMHSVVADCLTNILQILTSQECPKLVAVDICDKPFLVGTSKNRMDIIVAIAELYDDRFTPGPLSTQIIIEGNIGEKGQVFLQGQQSQLQTYMDLVKSENGSDRAHGILYNQYSIQFMISDSNFHYVSKQMSWQNYNCLLFLNYLAFGYNLFDEYKRTLVRSYDEFKDIGCLPRGLLGYGGSSIVFGVDYTEGSCNDVNKTTRKAFKLYLTNDELENEIGVDTRELAKNEVVVYKHLKKQKYFNNFDRDAVVIYANSNKGNHNKKDNDNICNKSKSKNKSKNKTKNRIKEKKEVEGLITTLFKPIVSQENRMKYKMVILEMLKKLHRTGVFHVDFTWANIMETIEGDQIKLIDFQTSALTSRSLYIYWLCRCFLTDIAFVLALYGIKISLNEIKKWGNHYFTNQEYMVYDEVEQKIKQVQSIICE